MKNRMKVFIAMAVLALFSMMVFNRCEKNELTPFERIEGVEESPAFAIAGDYDVRDACAKDGLAYRLTIDPYLGNEKEVVLLNFLDRGINLHAVFEEGKFVIPRQSFTDEVETLIIRGEIFPETAEGVVISYELQSGHANYNCGARCTPGIGAN